MREPVLLVHPPCPDGPPMYFGPPYGIALIAACLQAQDRPVVCRDFERSSTEDMIRQTLELIRQQGIRVVGIGGTASSRGPVYELVRALRTLETRVTIVLGGPFATALHPQLLRWLEIDFVVCGDGEVTLGALLDCLDSGADPAEVEGLAFLRDDHLVVTPPRLRVKELDGLPLPAFECFDVDRALREHQSHLATRLGQQQLRSLKGKRCSSIPSGLMLLSSYGCAYQCAFCPMSGAPSPRYRAHSPHHFVDMLEHFARTYHQRHFIFGDSLFTRDPARTGLICEEILRRGLDLEWMCMTRTDHVTPVLLARMAEAGCVEIVFGVESGSETVQHRMGKQLDLATVQPALAGCDQASIHSVMSLMVGNPGESEETLYETLVMVRDLEPDEAQVKITKVYPGTGLHTLATEAGVLHVEDYLDPGPHPPAYTAEHDADTLERFAQLIQPRTLRLETAGQAGLGDDPPGNRPRADLERDLLRVARRVHTLRFGAGSERRGDLGPLVQLARELRIGRVELETDGRFFADAAAAEELRGHSFDRIVVVFPIADAMSHERNPAKAETHAEAHAEALAGLKRLLGPGAAPTTAVRVDLLAATLASLHETVDLLLTAGARELHFHFAPHPASTLPTPERIARHLVEALGRLDRAAVGVTLWGLPYCYVPDQVQRIADIHHPFDEALDLQGHLHNLGRERRALRHYTDACTGCPHRPRCEGFWKEGST